MDSDRIQCDRSASLRYYDAVRSYYAETVLDEARCCCAKLDRCRSSAAPSDFAAAQLSFVGPRYAMQRDGAPWRVVVVSMQTGESEAHMTMARRDEQFRTRVEQSFSERNAHIKGTTSALRVLWGRSAGTDRAGEFLESTDDQVHVLETMALVNSTLCSSIAQPGSREGRGSGVMHKECTTHLRSVLELLEPTIVHSQGRRKDSSIPTPHRSLEQVFDKVKWHDDHVATAWLGTRPVVWNAVGHPSAKGKVAWQHPTSPYFVDVIAPSLVRARERAEEVHA